MELRTALKALAVVQGTIGLLQVLVPGWFYDNIANFGARSDHTLRDVATYYLASAVALAISVNRPSWRAPVLFVVLLQYVLHTANHVLDIGDASPGWVGPFDAISLAVGAGLLVWCFRTAEQEEAA